MYLQNADKSPLDQRNWIEISCRFKALGGERHIVLGNLDDDRKTVVSGAIVLDKFKNPHVDFAYYFVDDVCVTDASTNFKCACGSFELVRTRGEERIVVDMNVQKKTYKEGQIVIMENLEFEKGKASILNGTHASIYDLIGTLRMHPSYQAEITGHTDDQGDPQKNQLLSKKRAEAVYKFLLSSGIDAARLSFKGYGQSRPIALNKTSEGRKKNERIQVVISKK
jgi:outer membrane protein OmpA-like peptidoglycan-associated protein